MQFILISICILLHLCYCLNDNGCPKNCICENEKSIQCYRVHAVPSGTAKDTRKLNLGYNHIKDLKRCDFTGLTQLEEIVLSSCGIESIEVNTFKSQSHLKTLELLKNKLKHMPRGLPHSLEILKLGNNRIQHLQESAVDGLRNLRVLDLQNNLISSLRGNTFTSLLKLESLYLDGNQIESLMGSPKLPQLRQLSIANNKIPSLPANFFASLQSLKMLSLSGNHLVKVPQDLPQTLGSLNLDLNQIRALRSREMGHLKHLSVLSVAHNKLVSIDGSLRLPNLTMIELSGNHMRLLPSRLTAKLEKLDCRQNLIREVTQQELSGMNQLKHLFLENNLIHHFEAAALKNCLRLTSLALEQNFLSAIPEGLPETLIRLDLKGNHIAVIQEQELKSLKRLQVLNLRNNKLSSLNAMALEMLPRLRKVYLDGNPWNCSCELLRVKRRLLARQVEIHTEFCTDPLQAQGDSWRDHLRAQDKCEEHIRGTAQDPQERKSKSTARTALPEQTEIEEYYDYDTE
ncbi:nephrocan-like [Lepisosteus oculatus]|uniref:nephrocan-like n=1 Tax=Lepisosteus oculatus TaxID=7918 RepID=UPI0035F50792